jgi:hypothetical protein
MGVWRFSLHASSKCMCVNVELTRCLYSKYYAWRKVSSMNQPDPFDVDAISQECRGSKLPEIFQTTQLLIKLKRLLCRSVVPVRIHVPFV